MSKDAKSLLNLKSLRPYCISDEQRRDFNLHMWNVASLIISQFVLPQA